MATIENFDPLERMTGDFPPGDLFGTLDRRLRALIDRHRESSATVRDLRARLAERDAEIDELRQRVASLCDVRDRALERVDGALARLERISSEAAGTGSESGER